MTDTGLKSYLAIYKGKTHTVEARNSIEAQYKAIEHFNPSKKYMVAIRPMETKEPHVGQL